MRENHFAALAVIDRAAGQISANGHANHGGRLEISAGAPARGGKFVAELHHGRPDIVEELNLRDGLQSSRGHADGPADDVGFRQRRIKNALSAIFFLQPGGGFEYAALPFDLLQIFFAADVRHVLAKNENAFIAGHFVHQRCRNYFHHGLGLAAIGGSATKSLPVGSTSGEYTH